MFSGIVEAVGQVQKVEAGAGVIRIWLERPVSFDDLKLGDSISTNGICLTVEAFSNDSITFALAAETLAVLGLKPEQAQQLWGRKFNLERSLRFGDRIHGHLVTGHVDSLGELVERRLEGESLFLSVQVQKSILPLVWKKGSITLNGTSLTVNEVHGSRIEVCLIPETVKRTNLGTLKVGDSLTVEPDYMARAIRRAIDSQLPNSTQQEVLSV